MVFFKNQRIYFMTYLEKAQRVNNNSNGIQQIKIDNNKQSDCI